MQRRFEIHTMLTFRHPDLPELKSLHIPMPVESMVGKAYVSFPLGSEAEEEDPIPRVESIKATVAEVPVVPRPDTEESPEEESVKAPITDLHDLIEEVEQEDDSEVSELIDGFSADLLASVTHSANAGEVPEIETQDAMSEPEPVPDEVPSVEETPPPMPMIDEIEVEEAPMSSPEPEAEEIHVPI